MEPAFVKNVEHLTDTLLGKAVDNPLEAIRTADAILSIVTKALPTLPGETPFPIPRGIYEQLKSLDGK